MKQAYFENYFNIRGLEFKLKPRTKEKKRKIKNIHVYPVKVKKSNLSMKFQSMGRKTIYYIIIDL